MVYLDLSINGYNTFRSHIHQNCYTGILHGICMPIATCAFFIILQMFEMYFISIYSKSLYTKFFRTILFIFIVCGYLLTFPIMGCITILFYTLLTEYVMNKTTYYIDKNKKVIFSDGKMYSDTRDFIALSSLILLIGTISFLEFFSHGYLESGHSDITQVLNSIYHTPVYGMNSFYYIFTEQCTF